MFNNPNQIFQYNGSPITFQKGDSVMVNATQMAKPFSKSAKHWLSNQSTEDYLSELSKVRNLTFADLVIVSKGSPDNGGGTWMHEDVALEFARWLSPAFAIWCNDRIKELLKHGITATPQTIESILADPANGIKLLQALQVVQNSLNKKIQNLFANSKNIRIFAVLTDNGYTHFAGQAVKLLTLKVGIFIAQLQNIGDCLLRKIIKALGVETISVSSAKWQSLFPMPTTYLINAYRYE